MVATDSITLETFLVTGEEACIGERGIQERELTPLLPAGGNLADRTSFFASSLVSRRGTITPWAKPIMSDISIVGI